MLIFDYLIEFFEKLLIKNNKSNLSFVNTKKYSTGKYATQTIELNNKNIIYPDNSIEREIQMLYAEIREEQAKNREKISRNKFSYRK